MKKLPLLLIVSLLFCVSLVVAVPTVLNIQGTISSTCYRSATVDIYGYCPGGSPYNASCSIDNATGTANNAGTYGNALTYDNAIYPTGIDVLVVATNTSCSTTASGNNTATNQVGGGLPATINVAMTNSFTLDAPSNGSSVTNQTINFTWTNNIVNPSSTIQIDDSSGFGSIDVTQSNILTPNVTLATSLLDGVYYWRVLTYIGATLIQQSGVNNFTLSNSAPTIANVTPNVSTWVTATSTTLSFDTDLPAYCSYATSPSVSYASKTQFATTGSYSHSGTVSLASDGANNFYLQCNGTNAKLMPTDTLATIYRDIVDPDESSATVTINSGAAYSTSSTISVSWSGFTDATSGIVGYYVNNTNNEGTTTGTFTTGTSINLSGLSDGTTTIYVWAVDDAGNIGDSASDSIIIDTQGPTYGSWSTSPVNINMFTSSDVVVYVTVSDTSSLPTVPQLRYAIGSDAFTTAADMTLVGGSVYSFTVPNQAAPNDWANRAGENLTIIVNATDARGFSTSGNNTVYINDAFTAPTFTPLSSQTFAQGSNSSILLGSFDADGDTLVYSSNNSAITFVALNSSHSYAYWEPDNDDVGSNVVIFNVTDGYFNVSQAVIINVTDTNDDPVFSTIPALSAYEYVQFTYTINATDPDGDTLSYSTNTTLFAISSSGQITFTPTASHRGTQTIQYTVSDGNGGTDTANATFTVLYCGDAVCSASYESSDSCELDCENDESSQGFIINSKTCLGDTLTIRAVELLPRTTCPTQGVIINGWESCANITDTTINIEQDIQNTYVVVSSLVTDDDGLASYRPNETGDYRVRYDSTDYDDNIVYFGVRECTDDASTASTSSSGNNQNNQDQEVNLPFFEEPLTDEQIVQLSKTTKILYFVLLPFLFVLIVVAGTTTYYRYDKKKGTGSFSKEVDSLIIKLQQSLLKFHESLKHKKWYQELSKYVFLLNQQAVAVKKSAVKNIEPYIKNKDISVNFHDEYLGSFSETQLLLLSLFEYEFKSKNIENFTKALQREPLFQDKNLRIFALNAHKLGITGEYLFSATKDKNELLLLHENMSVKKSYPTLTDMKTELIKNNLVVLSLHMNTLNKAAPHREFIAVLTGFNKDGFHMLDYSFSRKRKTFVPTGLLQQAWSQSGYLECMIIKK